MIKSKHALTLDSHYLPKEDSHLSMESPFFIQSKPSELKRAPFIQTLYSGDKIKELLLLSDSNLEELYPVLEDEKPTINFGTTLQDFIDSLVKVNLRFSDSLIKRFYVSLLTKPFVILTGLSGSGKTKLAQAFVNWICDEKSNNLTSRRFKNGEELNSQRVTYKVTQSDLHSVTLTQIDSNTKVTLPYELIFEWIGVIRQNDFDISTPTRKIRDIVGQFTKYSTQLNSFESHLKVAAFELIERNNKNSIGNNSLYLITPVGADWTNREPILGYPNSLESNNFVKPDNGVLDLLLEASQEENKSKPHFMILDEMNLSHVERYFADFLSVMESGDAIKLYSGTSRESSDGKAIPQEISWPKNLFIIGTVNIDETTYMFSPKVLDRANVIEFRITEDELSDYLDSAGELNLEGLAGKGSEMGSDFVKLALEINYPLENADQLNEALLKFFKELKKTGAEFGYRTASEIKRFVGIAKKLDPAWDLDEIIDAAIMQKLLPKLHGSRSKLNPVLTSLAKLCIDGTVSEDEVKKKLFEVYDTDGFALGLTVKYKVSLEKICRMHKNVIANGFTSYAEA